MADRVWRGMHFNVFRRSRQFSSNKVFDPSTPSMRKDCDGEVEKRRVDKRIIKMTCSNLICPYLTSPY